MADRLKGLFDNARTETFEHDGVRITVREELWIDTLDQQTFRGKIRDKWCEEHGDVKVIPDLQWHRVIGAVGFFSRTVKVVGKLMVGKPPVEFKLPDMESTDELYEAFWLFLQLPKELMTKWNEELGKVNQPVPPPKAVTDDGKNTTST